MTAEAARSVHTAAASPVALALEGVVMLGDGVRLGVKKFCRAKYRGPSVTRAHETHESRHYQIVVDMRHTWIIGLLIPTVTVLITVVEPLPYKSYSLQQSYHWCLPPYNVRRSHGWYRSHDGSDSDKVAPPRTGSCSDCQQSRGTISGIVRHCDGQLQFRASSLCKVDATDHGTIDAEGEVEGSGVRV